MSKWFKLSDFTCRDECGKNNISPMLVDMLDAARDEAGIPFVINRGCSCVKHNAEVGGSETSSHLPGLAIDIGCKTSKERWLIVNALVGAGFRRIGIGETFIHADMDGSKPQNIIYLY